MSSSQHKVADRLHTLKLRDVLEEFDERLGSRQEPEILTLTEKMGFVPQRERFNKRLAVADTSNYKVIGFGDIAFNPYLLWAGAVAQNTSWPMAIISPLYPTFRVREGFSPRFVNHLLCGGFLRSRYDAISHGSVPRKRRSSVPDFLNLTIPMPVPALTEQERIVKLLDEADVLRKLRAQADRRTANLIPALFHEMFGDPEHTQLPVKPLVELVRPERPVTYGILKPGPDIP
jgi:type I restriction enzyme S subunit